MNLACVNDYDSVGAAEGARSRLPQPIHGTTIVSPGELSMDHDLDKKPVGKWCLLVAREYVKAARDILGVN